MSNVYIHFLKISSVAATHKQFFIVVQTKNEKNVFLETLYFYKYHMKLLELWKAIKNEITQL